MSVKRSLALIGGVAAAIWLIGMALTLTGARSTLSSFTHSPAASTDSAVATERSVRSQTPSATAAAADTARLDTSVTPSAIDPIDSDTTAIDSDSSVRPEITEAIAATWQCLRDTDATCTMTTLRILMRGPDLNSEETARLLHAIAATQAAGGERTSAIRTLRDDLLAIPDIPDDMRGNINGLLASLLFFEQRFSEAKDAIDIALELTPSDSLLAFRQRVIARLLDAPAQGIDREPPNNRQLLLLDR